MNIQNKREILAGAAKYDVSCASGGSRRENRGGCLGNAAASGIYKAEHDLFWAILPKKNATNTPGRKT